MPTRLPNMPVREYIPTMTFLPSRFSSRTNRLCIFHDIHMKTQSLSLIIFSY
ncbi:hypothetical protein BACPEC_01442 [[Bacteroides] pectinophilus ATCC 43243]|uniref:Uncharacterized protein n=1 Tax=[Bacteroides] pectinophilus ATCC 43243 TaxID=483218 RepID=B7ATH2_9FIRM|nr:hypothetical protein BACPEC_01442 [[Bacteroides] pectinophilus ATCC 43243]